MLTSVVIKEISKTYDPEQLKAWLSTEEKSRNREGVISALEKRINELENGLGEQNTE